MWYLRVRLDQQRDEFIDEVLPFFLGHTENRFCTSPYSERC